MPKVSEAHKQAVRQTIIDAAYRIIDGGDLSKLTTRAIIEEAGISNGTLYHYFPTIDHLFAELAEIRLREAMVGIAAARAAELASVVDDVSNGVRDRDGGDAAGLDPLVRWLRADFLGDRELAAAIAGFRSRIDLGDAQRDAVEGLNQFAVTNFGDLVRQLQDDGIIRREVDADAMVEMIDLLWDGLGRRQSSATFQTSYDRMVAVIVDVLLHGIQPPP